MSHQLEKIITIRHANAKPSSPPPGLTDKERPLSQKGWQELEELGRAERETLTQVTLVLCSSAIRTRQTLEGILGYLPNVQRIDYLDELYNAPVSVYLEEINLWAADHKGVLLIGHNPAVSEFLATVIEANGGNFEEAGGVPTAGVCVYDVRGGGDRLGYGDLIPIR